MTERKLNRLETTRLIRPMVDQHWESLRRAPERGQKTAWCNGPLVMLTGAMDIPTHFMAGYASYVTGIGAAPEIFEAAEADGQNPEGCSYHRLHMGLLSLISKGAPIREEARLPVPDLMICSRLCTEQSHDSDALYRRFGVPVVPIDLVPPHSFAESDIKDRVEYVKRQLREVVIPAIEKIVGRPYNYDRLSEIMAVLKKASLMRKQCLELTKNIPAPWTMFDISVSLAPVIY